MLSLLSTLVVALVFISMSIVYTKKRANQGYANDRLPAPDIPSFALISKLLFFSSMVITLLGFWVNSEVFLTLYKSPVLQIIGIVMVLIGFINLQFAFAILGKHYSPSFDAYVPSSLVMKGYYRLIRHPIYLFNLCVSFGLALASGSAIVIGNALIGLVFILKIIKIEEACLKDYFPEYGLYQVKTWRLLPYCY